MPITVSCPKCAGRLKLSRPPTKSTRVQCPRCQHPFLLPLEGIAVGALARPSEPSPIVAPGYNRPPLVNRAMGIGLIAAVLLLSIGIATALILNQPPTKRAETAAVKKVSPSDSESTPERPKKSDAEQTIPVESKVEPIKEKQPESPERLQEFVVLMIKAGVAEESKRLPEAVAAYAEALKIIPDDAKAKQKLQELQAALAAAAAGEEKDARKTQEELAQLLAQADKAMQGKQYAAALEIYKLALQKMPADAAAGQGLISAQNALTRDQVEQKKQTDFQAHLLAGRTALRTGRHADAIREFQSAQQILPTSFEAAELHRQAERQLAALQDQEQRKQQYQRLVDLGNNSYRTGRFNDAEAAFRQALQLVPNDPLATKGVAESQRAVQAAQVEFQTYMTRGNQDMREGRYQDASLAYREAVRLAPGNEIATKALREAENTYEAVITYNQSMQLAAASMLAMRYGDAVVAYSQALKAAPSDPIANRGLLEARQKYETENRNKVQADQLIQGGLFAVKLQKYADAARAFNDALRLSPNHPQSFAVQQQATYADAMGKGKTAMSAQRYAEAVQHFTVALQAVPNDFLALSSLTQARSLNRSK